MSDRPGPGPGQGDWYRQQLNIPVPDPSEITSREITRAKAELKIQFDDAIAALREFIGLTASSNKEIIESRLGGMDKTHVLLQDEVRRSIDVIGQESRRLEMLFDEKLNGILTRFDGIAVQFRERDIRTDQDKIAASTAVNAALQAQKEAAGAQNESNAAAITKSENSFTKEIDGLKALIATTKDSINSQIGNLTGRLDRGEGGNAGAREQRGDTRSGLNTNLAVIGSIVAFIALLLAVGNWINARQPPPNVVAVNPSSSLNTPHQ